jgi:flagellar FliJ protein
MKFKFAFQTVLRYRKTVEEIAQADFSEAMAELNRQKQILSDMQEEIALARENAFQTQTDGGKAGPALSQVHEFLKGQDIRIERQRMKIQEWQVKVEELQEILRQKAIDYKIIDELRDRKKEEFRIEQNKLDQKRTDDMNIMRFKPEGRKE